MPPEHEDDDEGGDEEDEEGADDEDDDHEASDGDYRWRGRASSLPCVGLEEEPWQGDFRRRGSARGGAS